MELRRELFWAIGALIVVNLSLAFGSIGLFVRMGPAIERILEENVYSIVAAEDILLELGRAGEAPVTPEARKRIEAAVERAKRNVTEQEELPVLRSISQALPAAMAGDAEARHAVVEQLGSFLIINREAMKAVDREAQRLGVAGAWAAVLIGFSSFLISLLVFTRLEKRLLRPLAELHNVLEGARQGERLRRCKRPEGPAEVIQITEAVNRLLDERVNEAARAYDNQHELERLALTELLERHAGGAAVIDNRGKIVRASKRMLALLAGAEGARLREALSGQVSTEQALERVSIRDRGSVVLLPARNSSESIGA